MLPCEEITLEIISLTIKIKNRVPWDNKEVIEQEEYSVERLKLTTLNQLPATSSTSIYPGATSWLRMKKNEITNAATRQMSSQARN